MSKKGSLTYQVKQRLDSMCAMGESKHSAQHMQTEDGRRLSDTKIYSYNTLKAYKQQCNYFVDFCRQHHGCKDLDECRQYVDEWLQSRVDAGLSAYTLKLEQSAVAKLYNCTSSEITSVKMPSRVRTEITRSRGEAVHDRHFSETRNADLVEFCRSTGLRRHELENIRGNQLKHDEHGYYLLVYGKGGRTREVPIVGDSRLVVEKCVQSGSERVWGRVSGAADIHGYRSDYARRVYELHARPLDTIPTSEKYFCRRDMKGKVYDRQAMQVASRALGHERLNVIASHYLR